MRKKLWNLFLIGAVGTMMYSCTSVGSGISKNNYIYEFGRNDIEVSDRKSAEASSTRIFGIDFARLFKKERGNFSSDGYAGVTDGFAVPIVGSLIDPTTVQNYALFNLINAEPDYDFVMYPRFEQKTSGIPFIFTTTNAKVSARLGKFK